MGVINISPLKKAVTEKPEAAKTAKKKVPAKKSAAKTPAKTKSRASSSSASSSTSTSKGKGRVLVIVESPSKAATLSGMLGKGYVVCSSKGHMKDLPKSRMAIDIENGFKPEYILVKGKAALKNELLKLAENAKSVRLASDPDREGESSRLPQYRQHRTP